MDPVVSLYPALEETAEHERLMRFQSRVSSRGCAYLVFNKEKKKMGHNSA
jgi:hypothetical protein